MSVVCSWLFFLLLSLLLLLRYCCCQRSCRLLLVLVLVLVLVPILLRLLELLVYSALPLEACLFWAFSAFSVLSWGILGLKGL